VQTLGIKFGFDKPRGKNCLCFGGKDECSVLFLVKATVIKRFDAGVIARELRRGYIIGDAVLRYAEVVVAR